MPQNRNNPPQPPPVMTWGKALPVLVVAGIFDLMGLFFNMFWFFGPALAAVWCTVKATDVAGAVGTYVGGALCATVATVGGSLAVGPLETFGIIMAMAVGLAGWLVVGLLLLIFNGRIFKENALWFAASLLIDEMPIIGSLPALTGVTWKMYHTQIKTEKAAFAKWQKEQADVQLQKRQRQAAQLMQAQAMQQEATNDATFNQIQAANDEKYNNEGIPENLRKAA